MKKAPNTQTRVFAYIAIWILALMFTVPFAIQLLPVFPVGLFILFVNPTEADGFDPIIVGWLLYLINAAFLFLTSRRTRYFIAYFILAVMLLTNVVGCRKILSDSPNVH